MRKLVVSTGNRNKIAEIKEILKDLPVEVLSKSDIGFENLEVTEDGDTLEENSLKKARALKELTEYMVMADDSGLFVDSLDGAPGVHSSRYGGDKGNDFLNNQTLLKNLEGKDRKASFYTVIAFIDEKGNEYILKGKCEGSLLKEMRGTNGFGYDPIFVPDGYKKSFAELPIDVKNSISHRKRAVEALKEILTIILGENDENTGGK
ncbi:MAG: RdgB/HAM1 family non-canonical purine NTP pyrophosphatase [Gudongella sp.]|jgi:XTP/dITP diphosphohydrolase|nr:RdgB/HAM1 family non-canonical purine NTP pyrophosphatase [Gudongella sp.]